MSVGPLRDVPRVAGEARAVAAMSPMLSSQQRTDLKRLIQGLLTSFNEGERRYARLGLLVEIVSARTGEVPATREYDSLCDVREADGEAWESSTTLIRAYGGWTGAVRAAMRFVFDGTASRLPAKYPDSILGAYDVDQAVVAFLKCVDTLGLWPTEPEYDAWRRLAREIARVSGNPLPRYPGRTPWLRLFGSWEHFETAARHAYRAREDTNA